MAEEIREELEAYPHTVMEKGFAVVGRIAIEDERLHYAAKALYTFICLHTQMGKSAFPGRDNICTKLGMAKNTYVKYMRQLVEYGYISIKQDKKKVDGGGFEFGRNLYTIEVYPQKAAADRREEKVCALKSILGDMLDEDAAREHLIQESELKKSRKSRTLLVSQNLVHEQKTKEDEKPNRARVANGGTPRIATHKNTTIGKNNINNNSIRTTTKSREPVDNSAPKTETLAPKHATPHPYPPVVVSDELRTFARKMNIEEKSLEKFVKTYGQEHVKEKLLLFSKSPPSTMSKITNPTGWLYAALKDDFKDADKVRKEAEKEKRAKEEAARKKRWEERNRSVKRPSAVRLQEIIEQHDGDFVRAYRERKKMLVEQEETSWEAQ